LPRRQKHRWPARLLEFTGNSAICPRSPTLLPVRKVAERLAAEHEIAFSRDWTASAALA
jgi:hypothetical protein